MVFFSLKPDSKLDDASLHTGCPVIKGIKWTGEPCRHAAIAAWGSDGCAKGVLGAQRCLLHSTAHQVC